MRPSSAAATALTYGKITCAAGNPFVSGSPPGFPSVVTAAVFRSMARTT